MILSGRDLQWYIEQKKLRIDVKNVNQFQQNGVDLRLKYVKNEENKTPDLFEKHQFYLGETDEYISMPDDLMGFVNLRSTVARHGILIPPTIVDAGFKGSLTIEMFYTKKISWKVPYNERFIHLVFAKMSSPAVPYNGKYQNQYGITGPKPDVEG